MPARKNRSSYKYKSRYKRNKGLNKVKKLFRLTLVSIVGLLLFSLAFYFYSLTLILKKPFAKASNNIDYSETTYNSENPFNLILIELEDKEDTYSKITGLYLLHLNATKNTSTLFKIPVDTNVEYSSRLGDGPLNKLYSMGNFGGESRGVDSVNDFIETTLVVDTDAYLVFDSASGQGLSELGINLNPNSVPRSIKYSYFLKLPKLFEISRQQLYSDLSSMEALKILGDIKAVESGTFNFLELSEENITNPQTFDYIWQEQTASSYLKPDRNTNIVLNATSTSGLASWGARAIKNSGGVIIDVGNYEEHVNESVIYTDLQNEHYLNYLVKFFGIKKVLPVSEFTGDQFLAKRADFLIILGEDNALRF